LPARTLVLDFALHGEGPAASWAAQAAVGQTLTVAGPRGSFVVPNDFDWYVLIGDETALPAIARRLEELPAGCRAIVRLALADAADRALLPPTAATLDLGWVDTAEAPRPAPSPCRRARAMLVRRRGRGGRRAARRDGGREGPRPQADPLGRLLEARRGRPRLSPGASGRLAGF
jgi:NADPH-dependent ferric siderophore reductase